MEQVKGLTDVASGYLPRRKDCRFCLMLWWMVLLGVLAGKVEEEEDFQLKD